MSNTKISELPEFTGDTTGTYLIMNNSGETTSYKVLRETFIGSMGTSGTSGTSGLVTLTGTTAGGLITYNGSGTDATVQSGLTYSGTTLTAPTGSFNSLTTSGTIINGLVVLTNVSSSLDFTNDTAAEAGGVPLGGLYRNGNFVMIRLS